MFDSPKKIDSPRGSLFSIVQSRFEVFPFEYLQVLKLSKALTLESLHGKIDPAYTAKPSSPGLKLIIASLRI